MTYYFLALYSFTFHPFHKIISFWRHYNEYHQIIENNYKERSYLLEELIKKESALVRCQKLHELGIPYKNVDAIPLEIVCQIIYKQLNQQNSFFIIDKGSLHGICVDMVVAVNNLLLGRVVDVYPWYAHVMPVTDARCYVPVVCATSGAHGVFHGDQIDFVSHLEPLVVDEVVLTSGDGLIYPAGLGVGRIKKFTLHNLGFLYEVNVAPLADFSHIDYCYVLSKNTQKALMSMGKVDA